MQGCSQDYMKGVLNSADPCSAQIHHLAKHLATIDNIYHPVYNCSHCIVKIVISYVCIVTY